MNANVTNLVISSNSCDDLNSLLLNECRYLKSIVIGDGCCNSVNTFIIDGFKSLRLLKIGKNSFNVGLPFDYSGYGMYSSPPNEFCIVNCPKLESIDIDESSFVNFEYFRLSKLPKLKSIRVASFGSVVPSSRGLSFEIKSIIDMILLMNRSS